MKMSDLYEAPIQDLEVIGSNEAGTFDANDTKAIFNPKWIKNVKQLYKNTPYNINVYIYNSPDGVPTNVHYKSPQFSDDFVKNITGGSMTDPDNSINVMLLQNEGDDKIPLTPWMIAHRMMHAMVAAEYSWGYDSRLLTKKYYTLVVRLMNIYLYGRDITTAAFSKEEVQQGVHNIFTFGSARKHKVTRLGEGILDSLVQYLVKGKVVIKSFDQQDLSKTVDDIEKQMNETAKQIFDYAVGRGLFIV